MDLQEFDGFGGMGHRRNDKVRWTLSFKALKQ